MTKAVPSSENARRTMRANRAVSAREVAFRKALWAAGARGYRVQTSLPGRPDIVFPALRLAIFVNGCFWHLCPSCNLPRPRDVKPADVPVHEVMAAGFPCTPFSLAGVSRKNWAHRAHGFKDEKAGNLFFQIVKLIGGPDHEEASVDETRSMSDEEEARTFQTSGPGSDSAPPVLLLENVRHLMAHDEQQTFRVIRRRLMQSGYLGSYRVINGAIWVPQNRQRIVIVGLRADLFAEGGKFEFEDPGDPKAGPKLDEQILEPDGDALERYRLTEGVWKALIAHRERHEGKGSGFGYGIAEQGGVTRTPSARYYKDGAEILLRMPDGERPRRLTPREAARLMGFNHENLGFDFAIPVSDVQAYRQFGNSVVVPQFTWVAGRIRDRAGELFARRTEQARPNRSASLEP